MALFMFLAVVERFSQCFEQRGIFVCVVVVVVVVVKCLRIVAFWEFPG